MLDFGDMYKLERFAGAKTTQQEVNLKYWMKRTSLPSRRTKKSLL